MVKFFICRESEKRRKGLISHGWSGDSVFTSSSAPFWCFLKYAQAGVEAAASASAESVYRPERKE